jgi:hypothetical protein
MIPLRRWRTDRCNCPCSSSSKSINSNTFIGKSNISPSDKATTLILTQTSTSNTSLRHLLRPISSNRRLQ